MRPGMTAQRTCQAWRRPLPHLPQHRLDYLALVRRQGRLGWDGWAYVIALDRKPGLDAGGEIVAREGFVDAPKLALQRQRLVPARGLAEIIELDALPRNDAGRSRHPAHAPDQHHRGR